MSDFTFFVAANNAEEYKLLYKNYIGYIKCVCIHATYFTTEQSGQKVSLHRWHNCVQDVHTALLQWLQRPSEISHSERHEEHALIFCRSFPLPLHPAPPPCIICWRVGCLPGALLQQDTLSLSAW